MANSAVRPHVPEEELHAYCDGELSPPQRVEIAEHLLGCLICRSHHAEVAETRVRAAALLAIASPRTIRGPMVTRIAPLVARRRVTRTTAAAAAAVIGVGVWFSFQPSAMGAPVSQLATSFTTPTFPGFLTPGRMDSDRSGLRARAIVMASRARTAPQVLSQAVGAVFQPRMVNGVADVDPVVTNDWSASSFDDAMQADSGALALVAGLAVSSVRVHPSTSGGRPTFMVRQQLSDGRPVWVFEGQVSDITPVDQTLEASGIAMSMNLRTRPDYVAADGQITRTVRMATIAGHLPVDSLNALLGKLKLR